MKVLITAAFILFSSAYINKSFAQISFGININVQPSWGPTGYDHVEYYYIPDIHCYYYVPSHQFIYQRGRHWAFSNELPPQYRGFDLFHSYKVVMNEPQPYLHFRDHEAQYAHFRGAPNGQEFIRDNHDERYSQHWHDQHEADEEWRHQEQGNDHRDGGDRHDRRDH